MTGFEIQHGVTVAIWRPGGYSERCCWIRQAPPLICVLSLLTVIKVRFLPLVLTFPVAKTIFCAAD